MKILKSICFTLALLILASVFPIAVQAGKQDVALMVIATNEDSSENAEILIVSSVDGNFLLNISGDSTGMDVTVTVTVKDHVCLYNAGALDADNYAAKVSFPGNENYNPAYDITSFIVYPSGTQFEITASPSFEIATGETLTLTPAYAESMNNDVLYFSGIPNNEDILSAFLPLSPEISEYYFSTDVCTWHHFTEHAFEAGSLSPQLTPSYIGRANVTSDFETPIFDIIFPVGANIVTAVYPGSMNNSASMEFILIKVLSPWEKLQRDLAKGGNVVLTEDVVCTDQDLGPLTVPLGITASLDLNGHTIDRGLGESGSMENGQVIDVFGDLTITDSAGGGCITGGNNVRFGGGVTVNSGSLTANGVTFIGNSSDKAGGAIFGNGFENTNITVNGGLFFNNSAEHAPAICASSGTTTVNGASFIRNVGEYSATVEMAWDSCDGFTVRNCVFLGNGTPDGINSAYYETSDCDYNWFGNMKADHSIQPKGMDTEFWYYLDLERTIDEATGVYSLSAVPYAYEGRTNKSVKVLPSEYLLPEITLDCTATGAAFEDDAEITLSKSGYASAPFNLLLIGEGEYEYTVGVTVPYSSNANDQNSVPITASLTFERTFDFEGSDSVTYEPGAPLAVTAYENEKGSSEKTALPAKALAGAVMTVTIDGSSYTCTADESGKFSPDLGEVQNGTYDATFAVTGFKTLEGSITVTRAKATVTGEPEKVKLIHTGESQALVTAGTASGGTMMYALGENGESAPASGWSEDVPEGTDVGNYYVWYKAVGDDDHTDSDAKCVRSMIVYKVSFKVVNGKWNDGTSDEKLLPLTRYDDEDLALVVYGTDLPAVGNFPDESYMAGSWDRQADVSITQDTVFTYTYAEDPTYVPDNATGSVTLSGAVTIDGRALTDSDSFTFELSDSDGVMQTKTNDASGNITFDTINYDKNDIGTHTYTVKQNATEIVGVTADTVEYTVTVTVSYNRGDENLTVAPSANYNGLDFTNTYTRQVPPEYKVPTDISATYGQTLSEVDLPDGWEWDDDPSTEVGDFGDRTFSATYTPADTVLYKPMTETLTISVGKAEITELKENEKANVAEDLIAEPYEQPLISAPDALPEGCDGVMYSADGGATWSDEIPTAKDAGEYEVSVLYVGDGNHEDRVEGPFKVTIASAVYAPKGEEELAFTKGSGKPLTAVFEQVGAEDASFEHYDYTDIDGVALVDGRDGTASRGSTVIKITPEYLEKLSVGNHVLTVHFTNGEASAAFKVIAKNSGETTSPQTGDGGSLSTFVITLALAASFGMCALYSFGKVKKIYHK